VLAALLRIGWSVKRQSGSDRVLSRGGLPDYVFSFHDGEELGPRILARVASIRDCVPRTCSGSERGELPQEVRFGQEHHVRDLDDLNELKRRYMALVQQYGRDVTEFTAFKQSLLDLNRRHRFEAARMYASIISKVERKVRRMPVGSRGRPTRS
jgi:hypothetical protein